MVALSFDSNGNVIAPPHSELADMDEHTYVVAFTNGSMADGRPYYAYMAVKPSMYTKFYELTSQKQPLVLSEYGKVIVADFMLTPPAEIIEFMRIEFGFENGFETELKQQITKQRQAFIKENEIKRTQDIVNMMKQGNYQGNLNAQMSAPAPEQKPAAAANGNDQKLNDIIAMMKKNQ